MALAKKMMGGGISAGQAKAINGDTASALTAAGTTQGTGYAINAGCVVFSTVAASSGATLPACEIADEVYVYNGGANGLTVYPDLGAQINGVAVNGGVTCPTATAMLFKRITTTRWIAMMSA